MKRSILFITIFFSIFLVTGCTHHTKYEMKVVKPNYVWVSDDNGTITIDTKDVTDKMTLVNYSIDDTIIQFMVVRGTDGKIRIAFNTCQACNPSPNAYFIQKGSYIECQNCGNRFHIDRIGVESGGCNPATIEEMEELKDKIILKTSYVDTFKEKFENWHGPTE